MREDPRHGRNPPTVHQILVAVGNDVAEGGRRRLDADAEEAEQRLENHHARDVEHRDEGDGRQDVGRDQQCDDPEVARSQDLRPPYIFALALGERDTSHHAGVDRPPRQYQHGGHREGVGPAHAQDRDRQHDHRDRELGVGDAHQDDVDPAAPVARDHAERAADDEHDRDRRRGDAEPIAQPHQRAHEEVAAELVGAGEMDPGAALQEDGRQEALAHANLHGIERRELRPDDRRAHEHGEDPEADLEARHLPGEAEHPPGDGFAASPHLGACCGLGRHQNLSLRSTKVDARSTMMLTRTRMHAARMATPWITGKSRCSTACTVVRPMPG